MKITKIVGEKFVKIEISAENRKISKNFCSKSNFSKNSNFCSRLNFSKNLRETIEIWVRSRNFGKNKNFDKNKIGV